MWNALHDKKAPLFGGVANLPAGDCNGSITDLTGTRLALIMGLRGAGGSGLL